jgi:RNA polymerase sigma factor (sigma-70 family)
MQRQSSTNISIAVSKYYDYWMGTALKIARNRDEASDLLHEVLSQVLTNPKCQSLCESGDIKQYVSSSIVKSYYSSSSQFHLLHRQFARACTELNGSTMVDSSDETWMGARLDNEQLDIVISRLPELERDIFLLYIFDDFDAQTVSNETGIPVKVIYRLINYSKTKIKKYVVRKK